MFLVSRNSSVGRALDWRSKGPRFNPGFRHGTIRRLAGYFLLYDYVFDHLCSICHKIRLWITRNLTQKDKKRVWAHTHRIKRGNGIYIGIFSVWCVASLFAIAGLENVVMKLLWTPKRRINEETPKSHHYIKGNALNIPNFRFWP